MKQILKSLFYIIIGIGLLFLVSCSESVLDDVSKDSGGNSSCATASLQINNNTSVDITEFYIAPSTATFWGGNQISSDISSGGGYSIISRIPGSAKYHVKAIFSDNSEASAYGQYMACGGFYFWTPIPSPQYQQSNIRDSKKY